MTRYPTLCAALVAALTALSTPLAAKTISFTGLFDAENYQGEPSPFSEQPVELGVVIEIDDSAPADDFNETPGNGSASAYYSAVSSLSYEAFGPGGGSLGQWFASDVELAIADLPGTNIDTVQFLSNTAGGPGPISDLWIRFEGDTNIFSGSGLDVLTTDALQAMHTGSAWLFTEFNGAAFGISFDIDFNSIEVVADPLPGPDQPTPVPLPAGLPLLLVGLGALGMIHRKTA
ncbi:VPLPA-CTERM sorting domain-containing protein [Roseobacter sp. A03A-229]